MFRRQLGHKVGTKRQPCDKACGGFGWMGQLLGTSSVTKLVPCVNWSEHWEMGKLAGHKVGTKLRLTFNGCG